jgi:hypothetical protein
MRNVILTGLSMALLGAVPAAGSVPLQSELGKYSNLYHKVRTQEGKRAPGRNIARDEVRFRWVSADGRSAHWATRPATAAELATSIRQLRILLQPMMTAAPPSQAPSAVMSAVARLPSCTWRPESGGSYTASNPSGAYGKYQIMPEWYASGRLCAGLSKSPSDQEKCAALIYSRGGGAGNWVNC